MTLISKAAALPLWAVAGAQLLFVSARVAAQAQAPISAPTPATAIAAVAPAATALRADPADPKAPVPATSYASPLRGYRTFTEPQIAPWRETNDVVGQRGGWRAYAREAVGSDAPDAPASAAPGAPRSVPAATPASGAHAGHEGHAGHDGHGKK
jgi:hypothetical protein